VHQHSDAQYAAFGGEYCVPYTQIPNTCVLYAQYTGAGPGSVHARSQLGSDLLVTPAKHQCTCMYASQSMAPTLGARHAQLRPLLLQPSGVVAVLGAYCTCGRPVYYVRTAYGVPRTAYCVLSITAPAGVTSELQAPLHPMWAIPGYPASAAWAKSHVVQHGAWHRRVTAWATQDQALQQHGA
jgi:hypothetical protein